MGKHKKHEEHENHERWLVCYADMVTLLFALFVVLYAMGVTELDKLSEAAKSIQFAFHIEGSGKTQMEGIHDSGTGDGQVPNAAPLQTGQKGSMEEYLDEVLQEKSNKVNGKSLLIEQLDDTFRITSPISAWFSGTKTNVFVNHGETYEFLVRLVSGAADRAAEVTVRIEAPYGVIPTKVVGEDRATTFILGHLQLATFFNVLSKMPKVRQQGVQAEFRELISRGRGSWLDRGRVVIEFANGGTKEDRRK